VTVDGDADIEGLKMAGTVVASCLQYMQQVARPGMTTAELDGLGAAFLSRHGAVSAPVLTYGFPGHTCISVNEHVAHGVPNDTVIQAGDLINIDVSAQLDGYVGDTGGSFVLDATPTRPQAAILQAARRARDESVAEVRAGRLLRVVGQTVERIARETGFRIIRNLGSHGVGRSLHEEPSFIPGYDDPTDTRAFHEGMVVTVEPFLTDGRAIVRELARRLDAREPPRLALRAVRAYDHRHGPRPGGHHPAGPGHGGRGRVIPAISGAPPTPTGPAPPGRGPAPARRRVHAAATRTP